MKIQTRNANFSKATHPSMFEPEKTRVVLVDGQPRGYYGRNKYGVTVGTMNIAAGHGVNPFLDTADSKHVYPTVRGRRRTADVVYDIAHGIGWDQRRALSYGSL